MRVGLVHGRFQPFHYGHKWLIDKMLDECDVGIVLVGSYNIRDPFSGPDRESIMEKHYQGKNLKIGKNWDGIADWESILATACLNIVNSYPTHIYTSEEKYSIRWNRLKPEIVQTERFQNISGSKIRPLFSVGQIELIEMLVPKESFDLIYATYGGKPDGIGT